MLFYPPPLPYPHPLKTPKIKILKNEKRCWRYHNFTHVYHKSQSYDVLFLIYRVRKTELFVILGHFLSFYHPSVPLMIPKNQNFEKSVWIYYPFNTCMYIVNEHHMIYGFWNARCDRQKFCNFGSIFALSAPWQPRKSKF